MYIVSITTCRRKILSPRFSPPVQRKGGVDQSTASFTEPMRPSTSTNSYMATVRQNEGAGEEEREDMFDEEDVSECDCASRGYR